MNSSKDVTLAGEAFSYADSARMAALVYRRFGRNALSARNAWGRLMQNNTSLSGFGKLAAYGLALERVEELEAGNQQLGTDVEEFVANLAAEIAKEILS